MENTNLSNLYRHQAAWSAAADFLVRERIELLQSMTDEDVRRAVARLFWLPIADADRRVDSVSGLAEQQRLFRRLG